MALGIIRAAKQRGIKIPQELSIVGFDDIEMASRLEPALTTVSHHKFEMGELAAKTLINAVEEEMNLEPLKILPTKLITRDTL